ncbi:DMT family transporter [Hwanghaeella grinnelliae]|uniref:DMT family transporter n=1 Tax=Hwanghaeella grinnelliae TaxID=2500179 RepID=A0A3S2Z9N2_9PROT|nr:DMT family transporter [Hwanghaeella grinnelliae]RVU38692.1 DMT family transporter [Hwanghaeella grinnelliae]
MSAGAGAVEARFKGAFLVVASAVLFASAGVFTKLIPSDAWTILFWRGLIAAVFLGALMAMRGSLRDQILRMGWSGFAAACVSSLGSVAFIPAFKETTVANVTLIYTSAPFLAAFVAWIWMREKPSRRCMAAAGAALVGVAVIFGAPAPGVSVTGDLFALWMTLCMSVAMVIYRRYPATPAVGPMVLSSLMLLPVAVLFSDPFEVPLGEVPMLTAFGLCFALASVALLSGAKLLPSSETALLSIMETPLAPLLAWLLLAETPSLRCLAGGVLIIAALIWYLGRRPDRGTGRVAAGADNHTV